MQISRQAFYNEFWEYAVCAHECISSLIGTQGCVFTPKDLNQVGEIKRKIGQMKQHSKVSIHSDKKHAKMFWLLIEQNKEVQA